MSMFRYVLESVRVVAIASLILGGASVALAVEAPADAGVHWRGPDGSTALQWAVYEGDEQKAKDLLDDGADPSIANNYGATPMQLAAEVGNTRMLELLLDAGADVDSPNHEGQTALMLVARTGNVEAAKLLLKHDATVDAREQWGGQTALMWASARRHPEMMEVLIDEGADVDARSIWRDYPRHLTAESRAKSLDTGGLTPLLYATRENCLDCARLLLENGADVNLTDPDRVSPLLFAILNTNWDIARLFIEAGADVNLWDTYGQSPLFAIVGNHTQTSVTANDSLNETTGTEILNMLLDRGADTNMQLFMRPGTGGRGGSRGTSILHNAVSSGDVDVVKLLIEHEADVNLHEADNETALMFATQIRDPSASMLIMDELLNAGIDVNVNAMYHHLQRARGGTALHYAVRAGNMRAIEKLVENGIDIDAKDPDGLTALDYAMARGYIPFLQMRQPARLDLADKLRELGATVELDKEPFWPSVGPPIGYEATIWPLSPEFPSEQLDPVTQLEE